MANDPGGKLVSFKVDAALGELLDRVPNRSEFIRQAILAQIQAVYPLCRGKGVVLRGVGAHYAEVFAGCRDVRCAGCDKVDVIPDDTKTAAPHWGQFFRGGPFLCADCYGRAGGS